MHWQSSMNWTVARQRAAILRDIRTFFDERNVIEVETPVMCQGTVTDVHLEAMLTKYDFLLEGTVPYYFQTSPEFGMKRLLASGYGCIYQICKAFRHEPYGKNHNPEFTMLEWYRHGFDHIDLMNEVELLLCHILKVDGSRRVTYQDIFIEVVSIDPLQTTIEECLSIIDNAGKSEPWLIENNDLDVLLQFIFSELIETKIAQDIPCFVYNFPASQAALARLDTKDNRVANRFECYFKGIELLNGFYELTDAAIQRQRFEQDNIIRSQLGLVTKSVDENFMHALESGLPDCSGVALGIDRLVMLALGKDAIKDVITFSVDRA